MPPILIEHPQHGYMHVYSVYELEQHEARGWHTVNAGAPASAPAVSVAPTVGATTPSAPAPSVEKRKPGRPRKVAA